jgi:hypothetical protein
MSSLDVTPCMGGWCHVRTRCLHYLLGPTGDDSDPDSEDSPPDRLCASGDHNAHPLLMAHPTLAQAVMTRNVAAPQAPTHTGPSPMLRTQAHSRWPANSL